MSMRHTLPMHKHIDANVRCQMAPVRARKASKDHTHLSSLTASHPQRRLHKSEFDLLANAHRP